MNIQEFEKLKISLTNMMNNCSDLYLTPLTNERRLGMIFERSESELLSKNNALSLNEDYLKNSLRSFDVLYKSMQSIIDTENFEYQSIKPNFVRIQRTSLNGSKNNILVNKSYINGLLKPLKQWIDFLEINNIENNDFNIRLNEFRKEANNIGHFLEKFNYYLDNLSAYISDISLIPKNSRSLKKFVLSFCNDYNYFINNNNKNELDESLDKLKNLVENIDSTINKVYTYINEKSPDLLKTMSDVYIREIENNNNNELLNFIKTKESDCLISEHIKLKGQNISDIILFKDRTYTIKDKGIYSSAKSDELFFEKFNDITISVIGYTLRKKPKIADFFKSLSEGESFIEAISVIDQYLGNENILKNNNFDLSEYKDSSFEIINDKISSIVLEHKVNQYARSIMSKKYEHLLSPEAISQFKILYESGVSQPKLQDYVGKKLARIKTSEELLGYVNNLVNHFSSFNRDSLFSKLDSLNIKPVYDKDEIIVFPINSFEESKAFGSISWCISRDSYYYNSYTLNNSKQYFLYDFNKLETDNHSLIGFTLLDNGRQKARHLRNDDSFEFDQNLEKIYLDVLKNDIDKFNLADELKDVLEIKSNKTIDNDIKIRHKI